MPRAHKYALLASLYIAQGLPFGFFMQSLPVLLRHEGMALETIGFSAILVLPWALKFLWAPILDKWGARKNWIIAANIAAVLMLITLSQMSLSDLVNDKLYWLFGGFFILNVFSATQDIATDGLAVNQLTASERGIGNGIQVAGYRVGMILGGGLLLAWFTVLGWQYSLWILAVILLLSTLPILFFHDKNHHKEQEKLHLKDFIAFIKLPHMGRWLLVLITYKFCDAFSGTMVRPLLIDTGLAIEQIALILGTVGFVMGLLGALLGGYLVNRIGRYRSLLYFAIFQAFAVASWVLVAMGYIDSGLLYGLSALEHFAGGLATAALFTAMMDHSRDECAGSDYTIQSCLVVMMNMVAAGLSGVSAATFGYEWHFILTVFIGLICLPFIVAYRPYFLQPKATSKQSKDKDSPELSTI